MTDKQPNPLALADALDEMSTVLDMGRKPDHRSSRRQAAKVIRTQHAAIERKDALLRQALETLENDVQLHCYLPSRQHHLQTVEAINSELSQ